FVGRAIVQAALDLEWKVTTFNRGLSGADLPGAAVLRGDRTRHDDLDILAAAGSWDGVIGWPSLTRIPAHPGVSQPGPVNVRPLKVQGGFSQVRHVAVPRSRGTSQDARHGDGNRVIRLARPTLRTPEHHACAHLSGASKL